MKKRKTQVLKVKNLQKHKTIVPKIAFGLVSLFLLIALFLQIQAISHSTNDRASASTVTPSVAAVGKLITHTNQPSAATEKMTLSPTSVGNVIALAIETKYPSPVPAFTVSSISGGGVTTWKRAYGYASIDGLHGIELWYGTVTTAGASTLSVSYTSGSTSGNSNSATSIDAQEFTSSAGTLTQWSADVFGKVDNNVSSTTMNYPTLTPSFTNEAYYGYLAVPGSVSAGSTPGVVYQTDVRGNQVIYDSSVSSAITPTAKATSQVYFSIGMLLDASSTSQPTQTPVPSTSQPSISPTIIPTVVPTVIPTAINTPTTSPLAGGTIVAQDTFAGRTVANSWGTASDGNVWVKKIGTSSDFSVANNEAHLSGAETAYQTLGTSKISDAETVIRFSTGNVNDDASRSLLRYTDSKHYYASGLGSPNGSPQIDIVRANGSTGSTVASAHATLLNNTFYWERIRVQTSGKTAVISAKYWQDGIAEPVGWNVTYTDKSPVAAGLIGIRGYDGGKGWSADHFSIGKL